MNPARRLTEARLALMMLTRLPAGRLGADAPSLAQAAWAFPLVGLVVGALSWGVFAGALAVGLAPLVAALLAIAAAALITGGLHYDGLADFADGIGGGRDRDHCLEIMRDSRIGSYGVLALILAVGLHGASLGAGGASDLDAPGLAPFLFIAVASRLAMVAVMVALSPARSDGLGHMAANPVALGLVPGAAVALLLGIAMGPAAAGLATLVALAIAAVAGLLAWAALRRIGGQTGDVLGAVQVTSEVAAWVVLSASW